MASAAISARLRYLHDAASRLCVAAPTSAAAFEAEVSRVARKAGLTLPESRRREVCSACGNMMVPGLSCTVTVKSTHSRSSKRTRQFEMGKLRDLQQKQKLPEKVMVYTCKRCAKITRVSVGVPHRARKVDTRTTTKHEVANKPPITESSPDLATHSEISQISALKTVISPIAPSEKGPSNAGSKQRAKARKQSGLQALLAKNKAGASTSSGGSLNLMDFMKIG